MALVCYPKPSVEDFIPTCTPLAIVESLETEIRERAESITAALLDYEPRDDPIENLASFLGTHRDFGRCAGAVIFRKRNFCVF
jgi:hypothetical protein